MNKKLLALDIGMVCITVDPVRALSPLGLDDVSQLPSGLFAMIEELECGRIGSDEFFNGIARVFPEAPRGTDARKWFDSILGGEIPGMSELLARLEPEWDFVFLSDISAPHLAEVRRKLPFFHRAAGGVYSFEVGSRKPDEAMFRAFEKNYRRPDFYADDRPVNIDAARRLGWNAAVFASAAGLESALSSIR
ncbi:MAG: hypothetical protein AB7F40_05460 [Victivallaceae bacterium]|nr:hypothetical protein [Victivallaceae bacterium]